MDDKSVVEYSAKWWQVKISKREKEMDEKWRTSGDKIVNRYLDEREDGPSTSVDAKRYNIFWANTEITKAALYATPPKPEVKRKHGDAKDDVARTAALILQRILQAEFEDEESSMHAAIENAVDDRLVPGMGQVWLRYDVETEDYEVPAVIDPMTGVEMAPATTGTRIVDEDVCCDYVQWRDFLYSPARTWDEVWWAGRRVWMRKPDFIKRFKKEKWDEVYQTIKETSAENGKLPKGFRDGRVEVFEVMCLDSNKVYWVSHACDELLDEREDPLKLEGFFQFPKPLIATHTTNDFSPRADYTMVQDQYSELDTLNERIAMLTKALRVIGVYDKTSVELKQMLSSGEMQMIPVDNWAAFAEKNGLRGQVDWFPVEVIAGVLEKLMAQRVACIQQIYELTSISDIMRGASNPRDTLGAQQLKAQYSSVRLQMRQKEVARFVGSILRIKCEIISKHWQPETIKRVSSIEQTESAKYADEAIALIKNSELSEYRLEIGEETLSLADYNAERGLRTEYLTAVGQFISQAGQILEAQPAASPYLLKMIAWVTASFRGASDIETVLDEAIQAVSQGQSQPHANQPDPAAAEMARAQADSQVAQAQAQSKIAVADHSVGVKAKQAMIKVAEHNLTKDPDANV